MIVTLYLCLDENGVPYVSRTVPSNSEDLIFIMQCDEESTIIFDKDKEELPMPE